MPISPHTLQYCCISSAREWRVIIPSRTGSRTRCYATTELHHTGGLTQSVVPVGPSGPTDDMWHAHTDFVRNSVNYQKIITVTDWGVGSNEGSALRWGDPTVPCLWQATDVFQLKMRLGWSVVVFCACELTPLFSAAPCAVRAVHTFDCRILSLLGRASS